MHNIIQLLPDSIANQIAAGEVVQRPASVVKELLENAIDAGAKSLQLVVRDAGRTLIQVIDDGSGMTETDARMSFERHATSKIRSSDDLFRIRTMGFRGEALASIAAVAQVEMRTRRADEETGTLLRIEGSDLKAQEPVTCLPGTNILVKNLFFNVPARRNFLKSNSVEMRHILDEFQRIALAHPEVAFSLYHNDQEVYTLLAGKLSRRIVDMFGKNYREQLAQCDEETPYVKVHGFIGKPESARKSRGEQFFFVNSRFVKHNYLHHAVIGAYEGTLPDGAHPFYVLFIDIDPSHIDINIHPTKTEIKFDDERSVYAIVMAAVRRAVGIYNLGPSLDFESNVNFLAGNDAISRHFGPGARQAAKEQSSADTYDNEQTTTQTAEQERPEPEKVDELANTRPSISSQPTVAAKTSTAPKPITPSWERTVGSTTTPKPTGSNWQAAFEQFAGSKVNRPVDSAPPSDWLTAPAAAQPATSIPEVDTPTPFSSVTLGSRANQMVTQSGPEESDAEQTILQVHNRYLLSPVKSGIMVIDQRGAYERILYDQLHAALTKRNGASQQLLFPKTVRLSPADFQTALDLRDELESLGFQFDETEKHTFVIRGVPVLTMGEQEDEQFANLITQLAEDTGHLKIDKAEALARSLARRSAGRHLIRLSGTERKALVNQLFASESPGYTPGGEPITNVLTVDKIAGLFKS